MTRLVAGIGAVLALVGMLVPGSARAQEVDPLDLLITVLQELGKFVPDDIPDPLSLVDPLNPACDQLDPSMCLFPFPSDRWTTPDDSTPTGLRVNLEPLGMPRNVANLPALPTEWNRNDGFSPGSTLLTHLPGADLTATFGLADRPERYRQQMTDPATSLAPDAPIVIVDADTGARHPYLAELDTHPGTPADARTLIVRPMRNFEDGHRYVVGFRDVLTSAGTPVPAGAEFAALRSGTAGAERQAHFDDAVFPVLDDAGVARDELVLAWDFTIASAENLAGRLLSMRDQTFAELGDDDLDDGVVEGEAPNFAITNVTDSGDPTDATIRTIEGTVSVPNYLTLPDGFEVPIPGVGSFPAPGARLNYGLLNLAPGPMDTPVVNEAAPTRDVEFVCVIPRTVETGEPAVPTLYGHGLLGSRNEATGSSTQRLRESGYMPCSVDWTGMATGDLPNVALILAEIGQFASMPDRIQQGFLDFLVLGRALAHPEGFAADPNFTIEDTLAFDPGGLVYDGNSQGAILGGGLAAFGVDFTRVSLGVPGMNYSTLLNRSTDWEGVYGELLYLFYPHKAEQQLIFNLIQMLWDRGEANGVANHVTSDPYPNTPPKQVLLQTAFGDHQVANLSAEVMARTMDASRIAGDVPDCRHWAVDQYWGFDTNDPSTEQPAVLAYYDSGTPTPPNGNVAPAGFGDDPHGDPRKDPLANDQKVTFFETGLVSEPHVGAHAVTDRWPERAGSFADVVQAQVDDTACLDFLTAGSSTGPPAPGAPEDPPVTTTLTPATPTTADRLPATGQSRPLLLAGLAMLALAGLRSGARRGCSNT